MKTDNARVVVLPVLGLLALSAAFAVHRGGGDRPTAAAAAAHDTEGVRAAAAPKPITVHREGVVGPGIPGSLWSLVLSSDLIVIGTVTRDLGARTSPVGVEPGGPEWLGNVTTYAVRVEKTLKPGKDGVTAPRTLTLRLQGGTVGNVTLEGEGMVQPVVGERYLMFLDSADSVPEAKKKGHLFVRIGDREYPDGGRAMTPSSSTRCSRSRGTPRGS